MQTEPNIEADLQIYTFGPSSLKTLRHTVSEVVKSLPGPWDRNLSLPLDWLGRLV